MTSLWPDRVRAITSPTSRADDRDAGHRDAARPGGNVCRPAGPLTRTGSGLTVLQGDTFTSGTQSFDGDVLFDGPITANAGGLFSVQGASRLGGDVSILASSVDLFGAVDSLGGARSLHVTSQG